MATVRTGIEVLRANGFAQLRGKRVGLLTNPSAVDSALVSTYAILQRAENVNLVALFSPEHGLTADAADGESVTSKIDPLTGLPVYSLYGATERPTRDMLENIDVIVVDIQDIGVRYYTFTWTMSHVLEAAGEYGVEVIILDRPNPLGGFPTGAPLDMQFSSLVGRYPVPTQPGMTLGELAQLFNATWNPHPAQLTVIRCKGYTRSMDWLETGLPLVPPSPNMPHLVTAQHYPGACLVEGTSLSEGRGTALPFEIVGAPGIDGIALAGTLNAQGWDGVCFRPHVFKPTASKHAGIVCEGVQAHITDSSSYQPVQVWLGVLSIIYRQYPFVWNRHFTRLIGSDTVQPLIENGTLLDALFAEWDAFCADFAQQRQQYLIYP
jgi:uncharacterized protein YbbC (DUF1343 family)